MQEARYYEKLDEDRVWCHLCPKTARLLPGAGVLPGAPEHRGSALHPELRKDHLLGVDPIEKKPLYHYYPGANIFSVGTFGCNFRCGFCQNWEIAHGDPAFAR